MKKYRTEATSRAPMPDKTLLTYTIFHSWLVTISLKLSLLKCSRVHGSHIDHCEGGPQSRSPIRRIPEARDVQDQVHWLTSSTSPCDPVDSGEGRSEDFE